jgi:hypothetical protein
MLTPEQRAELIELNKSFKTKWLDGEKEFEEVLVDHIIRSVYSRTGIKLKYNKKQKDQPKVIVG